MTRPTNQTTDLLESPAPAFSTHDAERIANELFGINASADPLVSERDQNFHLRAADGKEFVLKIANAAEDTEVLECQTAALETVALQDPDLPVPRVCPSLSGSELEIIESATGSHHVVRIVTYLHGRLLEGLPVGPELRRNLGVSLARLGRSLRGFFHPAAGRELLWDLKQAAGLRAWTSAVDDLKRRQLVEGLLDRFETRVLPVLPGLRAQVIHNDFNPANLLVDAADSTRLAGILDFGDLAHSALINDVAIAAAYQILDQADPIEAASELVGGYQTVTPLAAEELGVLFGLITTRLVATAVISAWRVTRHPENRDYILSHAEPAWRTLESLAALDPERAVEHFRALAAERSATPPSVKGPREHRSDRPSSTHAAGSIEQLLERRARLLGPALSLFYDRPLHIVRGEGAWLTDSSGKTYLDAYNNVAHVGHCHSHVVEAVVRQARTLNTNTRYLHETILDYAEQLSATLPGELSVCMFVCTGSEANDLAWRLAKAHTGGDGGIVIDNAYHGNTEAVLLLSPEELPQSRRSPHVKIVPAPNDYRGPHRRGEPDLGQRYAGYLDEAIDALRTEGQKPAAFLFDSIFASNGVLVPPSGYLRNAFERIRSAGGLAIADEVQAGFGRTGTHMWGFERDGVIPDIVTLGKPIGNGHPLAAVITRPEIVRSFASQMSYFNTFGGNPVSCAAGLAVLEVLEREQLQTHARNVGEDLKLRLEGLASQHSLIGDIRGTGLFWGIELVRDRHTLEPAADEARAVMNRMRELGVLIGVAGADRNVLKIRPPMVFNEDNAVYLVETLDQALSRHL